MTIFVRHSTTSFKTYSRPKCAFFLKKIKTNKKKKHLCSQCCLPIRRVQRQWARSDNFCGPDQQAVTKNQPEKKKHNVGLIVLARRRKKKKSENNTWQTTSSTLEVAKSISNEHVFSNEIMRRVSFTIFAFQVARSGAFPQDYLKLQHTSMCINLNVTEPLFLFFFFFSFSSF